MREKEGEGVGGKRQEEMGATENCCNHPLLQHFHICIPTIVIHLHRDCHTFARMRERGREMKTYG
ncbi:hypothetical protein HYC85_027555 [Camellia sinensis]|uniref:Uncharacterized protein n=1 Tax=Camellia sinensis TaxID=4442 RepID=A0A7J7GAR5_CAMSI|nr:hypothetical protein HYC85_027555 [Camellia sinensis]